MSRPIQLRHSLAVFAVLALACLHGGCVRRVAKVDSTRAPVFAAMLGAEFELKEEFVAIGVKSQRGAEPVYVMLVPRWNVNARYQVDLGTVPADTRFRIVGMGMLPWGAFSATEYTISFSNYSSHRFGKLPVMIPYNTGFALYVKPVPRGAAPALNELYFRPVGGARK